MGGVLPAYAGMMRAIPYPVREGECAPRVCGDDPLPFVAVAKARRCSPRMRG